MPEGENREDWRCWDNNAGTSGRACCAQFYHVLILILSQHQILEMRMNYVLILMKKAREVAQWLSESLDFTGDLNSVPFTHVGWLTTCNFSSRGFNALNLHSACPYVHVIKNKNF